MPSRGDYEREWTERRAEWEAAEVREADRRAAELLDRFLTAEQKKTWYFPDLKGNRYFHLTSQYGRQLVINRDFTYNVYELTRGSYRLAYCAGPKCVPIDDFILAQLLLLKYSEAEFFNVANCENIELSFRNFNPSA